MMREFNKSSKGFTLAEVLITLGVIGVVAATSMPTLIMNHKKQEYVVRLRKAHSLVSQAIVDIMRDTNAVNLREARFFVDPPAALLQHVKGKYVDNVSDMPRYKMLGSNGGYIAKISVSAETKYTLLNDGTIIYWPATTYTDGNLYISIDVNGFEAPNRLGRDTFAFAITPNGSLEPVSNQAGTIGSTLIDSTVEPSTDAYGVTTDSAIIGGCDMSQAGTTGRACAAKIIKEGWKMNY